MGYTSCRNLSKITIKSIENQNKKSIKKQLKKILLMSGLACALIFSVVQISTAADLGGFNNMQQMQQMPQMQNPFYDMQQLQNEYRAKRNSVNEFQSFEQQKKARQEMIKKENERQKYLEERAIRTKSTKQFVNDNGVIRIEDVN